MTTGSDENVGGLDVAVDDAFGMRRIQRVGNLDAQIEQPFCFQRAIEDGLL